MAGARLTFEERNSILKWYIKFENVAEVQRQSILKLYIKFENVAEVQRQWKRE
jgi:hypothetical protein